MRPNKVHAILIVGPTASGKTALALALAQALQGEIVSADSRQVYRYMDIGTAKPTREELAAVPHHCINILTPDQDFSAGAYARIARPIVQRLLSENTFPIITGGSGLYISALIDGFFPGDYKDAMIRWSLKQEAEQTGTEALYARLSRTDPAAAGQIHPNDLKRIVRALEVCEVSGKTFTQIQQEETEPADFPYKIFGLTHNREALYARINLRVDQMIAGGLVEEVANLLKMGYSRANNSLDSVGYKEIIDYLDGLCPLDEAVDRIKRNTRRYAKRQITWFKRDQRIVWLSVQNETETAGLCRNVVEILNGSPAE